MPAALPHLAADERTRLLAELGDQYDRSRETFADHFRTKYGADHTQMPVWMACETMTFGNMLTIYRGVHPDVRRAVAALVGVHDVVLESWLLALNTVRNICAHHGRLWNRELGTKPKIPEPRKNPQWHDPVAIPNDRVFGILTICHHCLRRIAPQSGWADRWRGLLREYPYVPRGSMGVPKDWEASPIWK